MSVAAAPVEVDVDTVCLIETGADYTLAEDDITVNILPHLMPFELNCFAAACRPWRRHVATFAVESGGASRWMFGPYCSDLEADAIEMCRCASSSTWFATTGYTLAVMVAASPGEDLLQRALDVFDHMPVWVARPNRDVRLNPIQLETSRNHTLSGVSGEPLDRKVQERMRRALSEHWGSAYVSTTGEYDCAVQENYNEIVKRLAALWALDECIRGTKNALFMEEQLVMFRNASLRANERWTVYLLAMCSGNEDSHSHKLALALMSYHEGRLMG